MKDYNLLHNLTNGLRFGSKFAPRITGLCHELNKRLNYILDAGLTYLDNYISKTTYGRIEYVKESEYIRAIKTAMYTIMFYM